MSQSDKIRSKYQIARDGFVQKPMRGSNITSAAIAMAEAEKRKNKNKKVFGVRAIRIAHLLLEGKDQNQINKIIENEFGSTCSVWDFKIAEEYIDQLLEGGKGEHENTDDGNR